MPTILLSKIYPKGSALKNLRVGSTDVKYVKRGGGPLFYDTLKSTTYGKPSITLTYPTSNTSAAGGTTSPSSFSYSQSWYYTGHSGNTYPQSNKTSGATVEYSISGTGASISSTGVVTWASRGTSYASGTRSATVTVKVTLNGQSNTATFVVKLAKNQIKAITGSNASGGALTAPGTYSAGLHTQQVANKTAASCSTATVTFESGSSGSVTISSYGSVSGPTYSWKSSLAYFTLSSSNAASLNVSSVSRGTSYSGSARSATITRTATFTITINASNSSTGSALTYSPKPTATCTCTQGANTITITSVTSTPGSITGSTFAAAGETKSTTSSAAGASAKLTYSSGSSVTTTYNSTDYGTWAFHGYSWSSNLTYATVNSSTYNSLSVTMSNNKTLEERSATITRSEAGFTFTLSSTYGGASKKSTGTSCTCTVTQSKGYYSYSAWAISISASVTSVVATGGPSTITASASRTYGWNGATSGAGTQNGTIKLSMPSTTGATLSGTTSGSKLTWANNTTTSARSATVIATCQEDTSKTKSVTISQAKGSVEYKITPSVTATGALAAAGATKTSTITYSTIWNGVTTATGTALSGYGITESSDTLGIVTASGTSGTVTIKSSNNTSTNTGTFSYIISKSGYTSATISGSITKGSVAYTINNVSTSAIAAGGGSATASITCTVKWNGITTSSNTAVTGYSITEASDSTGRFSASGTTGTVTVTASNNKSSSSASASYTISKSGFTSGTLSSSLNAGTKNYSGYVGTLYANKYNLSAGADSATITFGDVYRYYRWNAAASSSANDGIELYSGTVYCTISESSSYLSGGTGSYTNSGSTTTCTLSKSTYGTSAVSAESATLYLRLGSASGTSIDNITITTTANSKSSSISYYTYSSLAVSIGSGITAAGGSASLSATANRTPYYQWTSGSYSAGTTANVSVTSSCTFSVSHQSLSSSTSLGTNGNISRYSVSGTTLSHGNMAKNVGYDHVTVKATASGLSGVSTATASTYVRNVKSSTPTITYGIPNITRFSYDTQHSIYPSTYAGGTNIQPTITVTVTDTYTYSYTSGSSDSETKGGNYALSYSKVANSGGVDSCSDSAVASSTGYVTFANSGGGTNDVDDRTCWVKVVATNTGDSSKTKTAGPIKATQLVDSIATGYSWTGTPTVTYANANYSANSTHTPTISGFKCVIRKYWGFLGTTISETTVTTPAVQTYYFGGYSTGTTTFSYGNIVSSTGKVTWTSANSGSSVRTVTVYVTLKADGSGASGSYKQVTAVAKQGYNAGSPSITSKYTTITFRNTTSSGGYWTFNIASNAAPNTQYYIGHSGSTTITFTINVGNASQTATGISGAKNVSTNTTHLFNTSSTGSGLGYTLTLHNTTTSAQSNPLVLYIR